MFCIRFDAARFAQAEFAADDVPVRRDEEIAGDRHLPVFSPAPSRSATCRRNGSRSAARARRHEGRKRAAPRLPASSVSACPTGSAQSRICRCWCFFWRLAKSCNSLRHGAHHSAHSGIRSVRPLNSEMLRVPFGPSTRTSGNWAGAVSKARASGLLARTPCATGDTLSSARAGATARPAALAENSCGST